MKEGEQQLIQDAIRGKSQAFGTLYDWYHPQIYRFVYLKVSHREEAEDLTHQIFLNAWQKIHEFSFRGHPFSSWLYRIARNQVIDHYRTKKITVEIEEAVEIEAEHEKPERNMTFELEDIKKAVRRLTPEYQDIIILRFVEDFSVKETAEILNKSALAVKLLQHRALKKLRITLQES